MFSRAGLAPTSWPTRLHPLFGGPLRTFGVRLVSPLPVNESPLTINNNNRG